MLTCLWMLPAYKCGRHHQPHSQPHLAGACGLVKGALSACHFGGGLMGLICVGGGGGLTAETSYDPDHLPLAEG